uniref:DNA-directed RNA polymerase subunit n=1 Tax=Albugo laibachii Nc14 TaxID=890382 RepID=F0VZH3_9STRA|nr:DNAdirected RNA polymerase I subunit RPA1 putative [Albugo laibachii Nc14]|eukprot:CCA14203.1 DNAdirected RNA polymerase I subunit RPA1 putative [Albugo laibachii Nc14]
MHAATDQTIIRHEPKTVQFGIYSDHEIRQLSVKEIVSQVTFDALNNAVVGGLYDPALGPIDYNRICPTCHQTQKECPGHMGHIELPVPVYNPVLFPKLLTILKRKCFNCHKLRVDCSKSRVYRVKIMLYDCGLVEEVATLTELLEQRDGIEDEAPNQIIKRQQAILDEYERFAATNRKLFSRTRSRTVQVERERLVAQVLKTTKQKCENCGAITPSIRQDSNAKIFIKSLSARSRRNNRQKNLKIGAAVDQVTQTLTSKSKEQYEDESDLSSEDSTLEMDLSEVARQRNSIVANHTFLPPLEVQSQLQLLWKHETGLMELCFGENTAAISGKPRMDGWQSFFLHVIPVTPSRFRPPVFLGDDQFEHAQNTYLSKIIQLSQAIVQKTNKVGKESGLADSVEDSSGDVDLFQKLSLWTELQVNVNSLVDSTKARPGQDTPQGIRQLIEKKEGLFRKNMMGKRVNYAARSVISPDPYISTSQIGVPLRFAKTLTYPQPVTPWNIEQLRELVINGPEVHPGANFVENEMGRLIDLSKRSPHQRFAISKTLLTRSASAQGKSRDRVKRVWRHLQTGDVVLMNRQPTLHKPSMMAHVARVLTNPEMQTIRMHYANCNTYNADFDGDEMNLHFPQNELGRSEAYNIAANDHQYLVPTDGSPLRGLIQDHVVCGIKLTQRDTFLTKDMYNQLLYNAWASIEGLNLPGMIIDPKQNIEIVPPAILKPKQLWTGKQVITSVLRMLTKGLPPLHMTSKAKVKGELYGIANQEHIVVFRDGELLQGVLDKSQFGASMHGLVHATYEIYGARIAADLLTALGRLFTCYLQFVGHTCAVEDLTLNVQAEKRRSRLIKKSEIAGEEACAEFAGLHDLLSAKRTAEKDDRGGKKRRMTNLERAVLRSRMATLFHGRDADQNRKALDAHMMGCVHKFNSEIIKTCLPVGQTKPFPSNNFSMMVLTGAKGSMVNHSQISCGLGQQALEGRRVPILVSGRSLPSFEPFDPSPRAGGYITDRFLTGLRPQEYYHHCMAGREGLVDTAVKTSRSGYLQRCLVKHLEDLQVAYDHTVRDSEGNVIQFLYGEDGVDPVRGAMLTGKDEQFTFQVMNHHSIAHKYKIDATYFQRCKMDIMKPQKLNKELRSAKLLNYQDLRSILPARLRVQCRRLKNGKTKWKSNSIELGWVDAKILRIASSAEDGRDCLYDIQYLDTGLKAFNVPRTAHFKGNKTDIGTIKAMSGRVKIIQVPLPDPVMHALPLNDHLGLISEQLQEQLERYQARNPSKCLNSIAKDSKQKCDIDTTKMFGKHIIAPEAFQLLVWASYLQSLCAPGENVGVLAAQSIGEPSTQMTLNTFHLAGHGAANVTLGIPRLREIIMTASEKMSTPMMTIPVRQDVDIGRCQEVEQHLNQVSLSSLISNEEGAISVTDQSSKSENGVLWVRDYIVRIRFHRMKYIRKAFGIRSKQVYEVVGRKFVAKLLSLVARDTKRSASNISKFAESVVEDDVGDAHRRKPRDEDDSDDDDNEQGTLRFGKRDEIRGYDEVDAEEDTALRKSEAVVRTLDDEEALTMDEVADEVSGKYDPILKDAFGSSKESKDVLEVPAAVRNHPYFMQCQVDKKGHSVELRIRLPTNVKRLLMVPLVEKAADSVLVHHCPGISRCYLIQQHIGEEERPCIQTEGLNFQQIWEFGDILSVNQLMTNDIYQVLKTFGVEAARASISKQINEVFGVYGISVDPRHLSLLADYMTAKGGYMPLNRTGMVNKASSFQQITFETSMKFLTDAALNRLSDQLVSPSGRLVLGLSPRVGTGSFSLLCPLPVEA